MKDTPLFIAANGLWANSLDCLRSGRTIDNARQGVNYRQAHEPQRPTNFGNSDSELERSDRNRTRRESAYWLDFIPVTDTVTSAGVIARPSAAMARSTYVPGRTNRAVVDVLPDFFASPPSTLAA